MMKESPTLFPAFGELFPVLIPRAKSTDATAERADDVKYDLYDEPQPGRYDASVGYDFRGQYVEGDDCDGSCTQCNLSDEEFAALYGE